MSGIPSSWVVSDFLSGENNDFSLNNNRRPSSSHVGSKSSSLTSLKNDDVTSGAVSSRGVKRKQCPPNSSSQPVTTNSRSALARKSSFTKTPSFEAGSTTSNRNRDEMWADKNSPTTADNLSVHPKKVQEVKQWFQSYFSNGNHVDGCVVSPFLLLTGPSGCGKSATVKALAADLRICVKEWTNPTDTRSRQSERELEEMLRGRGVGDGEWTSFQPSQLAVFTDFILRTNKYLSLPMGSSSDPAATSYSSSTLILIDEFPNAFLRDPAPFHRLLIEYSRRRQPHPMVFVVSDSSSSSSDNAMLKLFPKGVVSELDLSVINFNAVADSFVRSCLKKISARESAMDSGVICVTAGVIDGIVDNSNGDLRAAINNLQFLSLRVTSSAVKEALKPSSSQPVTGRSSKSQKSSKSGSKASKSGQRDSSLFLFHALGKILHCKRDASARPTEEKPLPAHLVRHRRDLLQFIPEEVVGKTSISGDYFNLYLHHNYPDYYVDIADVTEAADYLSIADTMSSMWSEGRKEATLGYESSLATRGIVFCNGAKAVAGGIGAKNLGFRPMKKPLWFDIWRRRRERLAGLGASFRELRETPENLTTTTLPAIKNLNKSFPNSTQTNLMKELTTFKRGVGFPASSEVLRESDVVAGGEEEEEEKTDDKDVITMPSMDGMVKSHEPDICQYDDDLVDIDDAE